MKTQPDEDRCRNCGKRIQFRDGHWIHADGVVTRHRAEPMTDEDKEELAAGASGG